MIRELDQDTEPASNTQSQYDDATRLLIYTGLCLNYVQLAERALQAVLQTVLNDKHKFAEQSELERKQTLGDFIRELKQRSKLPQHVKDDLYDFLNMRNRFIHEMNGSPRNKNEYDAALLFLVELLFRSLKILGLLTSMFQVWSRDKFNQEFFSEEFFENQTEKHRALLAFFEDRYGPLAKEILARKK